MAKEPDCTTMSKITSLKGMGRKALTQKPWEISQVYKTKGKINYVYKVCMYTVLQLIKLYSMEYWLKIQILLYMHTTIEQLSK